VSTAVDAGFSFAYELNSLANAVAASVDVGDGKIAPDEFKRIAAISKAAKSISD
jgi:hypothetical protein